MPDGLEAAITPQAMADLIAFSPGACAVGSSVEGAIYGPIIARLRAEGSIIDFKPDTRYPIPHVLRGAPSRHAGGNQLDCYRQPPQEWQAQRDRRALRPSHLCFWKPSCIEHEQLQGLGR